MKICVAAVVKDEEVLLPVFLDHYARFADSIVIWDNGSSDHTLEIARAHPKVEVHEFTSPGFDMASVFRVLGETKRRSIGKFDWCLFPDCDELIMSKVPGGERELLCASSEDVLIPEGYCLVEMDHDSALDPRQDMLAQRRWGYLDDDFSKPIVMRPEADLKWDPGRHSATFGVGCTNKRSKDLLLIHLDTADFNLWLKRKMRPISPEDRAKKYGVKRWDRPRAEYDVLWATAKAKASNLDTILPQTIRPA